MKGCWNLIFRDVEQEVEGVKRSVVRPDEGDKEKENVVNWRMWAVRVHVNNLFVSLCSRIEMSNKFSEFGIFGA